MDKWDKRFMQLAEVVAGWTSCAREGRAVGAIITRNKRILTTGYNGAPAGIFNCRDKGYCMRDRLGIPSGTQHEKCFAVHAEQNAIIQAAKLGVSVEGATLYCISRIVYKYPYPDEFAQQLLAEAGITVEQLTED